jgi:hypothetical protein
MRIYKDVDDNLANIRVATDFPLRLPVWFMRYSFGFPGPKG